MSTASGSVDPWTAAPLAFSCEMATLIGVRPSSGPGLLSAKTFSINS